jgi:hypothetical protein
MFGVPDRIIDTGVVATSKGVVVCFVNVAPKQESGLSLVNLGK